jgi:hypothetical protein
MERHCDYEEHPNHLQPLRDAREWDPPPDLCGGRIIWRHGDVWYCEVHGRWLATFNFGYEQED